MFHHEARQELINSQKAALERFDKTRAEYNICYDIAEAWQLRDTPDIPYVSQSGTHITLFRLKTDTQQHVDLFMEKIEDELLQDAYNVDVKSDVEILMYRCEHKQTGNKLTIHIYNSYCKTIKTGKLIPETITVCNHA